MSEKIPPPKPSRLSPGPESEDPTPVNLKRPLPLPPQRTPSRMPEMGPLEPLMKDPTISEIMVNDLRNVIVEKEGKMGYSGFTYPSIDELNRLVRNILDVTGRALTPENPYLDVMLPDGSRVNMVGAPITLNGPCLTIRKFPSNPLTIQDLIHQEFLSQHMAHFLNCCVIGRLNILVCGGTGSGKTTLLNTLASFIPKTERMITIEDTPELQVRHPNSVRLQTKPASPTSAAITARELIANSLRMRPDRILVGECRRSEAFDMLQAMNTGHPGSMTTLHANSPRDGLARLETLCLMTGIELPLIAIRKQMVSALDLILQVQRFKEGRRRLTRVTEITGIEQETMTLQDLFVYSDDPLSPHFGQFVPSGIVPVFAAQLREHGIEFPPSYFG